MNYLFVMTLKATDNAELPLKGNYDINKFKMYFCDTGLFVALLDDEAQEDLRANKNLSVYKGALYESIVGEALIKEGYAIFERYGSEGITEYALDKATGKGESQISKTASEREAKQDHGQTILHVPSFCGTS